MGHHDCKCSHNHKHRCHKKRGQSQSAPMMRGDTSNTSNGWRTTPLVTVGEMGTDGFNFNQENFDYNPVGIFDGITAFSLDKCKVRAFTNHELFSGDGLSYILKNGTSLTGGRIDAWDMTKKSRKVLHGAGAYDTCIDREGIEVTDPQQFNKGREESSDFARDIGAGWVYDGGMVRLCSACALTPEDGFVNNIHFSGEEWSQGQGNVLDVCTKTLYVVPMTGQFFFENACPMERYTSNKVVLLIGNDNGFLPETPLWLYIGEKGATTLPDASYQPPDFLVKNGLGFGRLYAWVPDNCDFEGTGSVVDGKFVYVKNYDPTKEGAPEHDNLGFLHGGNFFETLTGQNGPLINKAFDLGAFGFAPIEDVSANPQAPQQAVFASSGANRLYTVTFATEAEDVFQKPIECIDEFGASLRILYDGSDGGGGQFTNPQDGIRNPDNLNWADDGFIYVCEDIGSSSLCEGGPAPSIWQVNPSTGGIVRILEMDRTAVPEGQIDVAPEACTAWAASGVVDVSHLFDNPCDRTLLLFDVQADSIVESNPPGLFADDNLVAGGQLLLATGPKRTNNDLYKVCGKNTPFSGREVGTCCQDTSNLQGSNLKIRKVENSEDKIKEKLKRFLSKRLSEDEIDAIVSKIKNNSKIKLN